MVQISYLTKPLYLFLILKRHIMVNLGKNVANLYLYTIHIDIYFDKNAFIPTGSTAGAYSGICPGGSLIFFLSREVLSTRWGMKTP